MIAPEFKKGVHLHLDKGVQYAILSSIFCKNNKLALEMAEKGPDLVGIVIPHETYKAIKSGLVRIITSKHPDILRAAHSQPFLIIDSKE